MILVGRKFLVVDSFYYSWIFAQIDFLINFTWKIGVLIFGVSGTSMLSISPGR